jgi:glyoxylate reductase
MGNYRVFSTCNIGREALARLTNRGYELEVFDEVEPPGKQLILEKVRDGIDGLITTLRDPIDGEVLEAGAGSLKVVAQDAVGFDNIDREAANRCGIPVTNTADVLTDATAEFALFMLGSISRKLYPSEVMVRDGLWKTWHPSFPILGVEVTGKTVGVIGTGRIGKAFMAKCLGLEVDLICSDPFPDLALVKDFQKLLDLRFELGLSKKGNSIRYEPLEQLLKAADYISLHVPLNDQTHHLINEKALRRMKKSAFLINSSRGPVVDEAALYTAVKEGWIAGAALDVFEIEPLPAESPLRDPEIVDRLRLFHHFASGTNETRLSPDPEIGMAGRCVQGLIDVLENNYGGDPTRMPYVINKEAFGNVD